MKKLILLSIIALSLNAQAAPELDIINNFGDISKMDAKMIIGFGSYHFDKKSHKYLNEVNPSIGVELFDIQAVYVSANSWDKKSLYLTWSPDYEVNSYLTITGNLGFSTGYKCTNTMLAGDKYMPINYCSDIGVVFVPAVTIEFHPLANELAFNVSIAPAVAMFSMSYDF